MELYVKDIHSHKVFCKQIILTLVSGSGPKSSLMDPHKNPVASPYKFCQGQK